MEHRGYQAGHLTINDDIGSITGRLRLDRDVVTFEADTVAGLAEAFQESVDDYLDSCARDGIEPESPPSALTIEAAVEDPKAAAIGLVRDLLADLKDRRSELGISLTKMSEASGLERSFVVKLESSVDQNPTMTTLVRYASALGVVLEIRVKVSRPRRAKSKA